MFQFTSKYFTIGCCNTAVVKWNLATEAKKVKKNRRMQSFFGNPESLDGLYTIENSTASIDKKTCKLLLTLYSVQQKQLVDFWVWISLWKNNLMFLIYALHHLLYRNDAISLKHLNSSHNAPIETESRRD